VIFVQETGSFTSLGEPVAEIRAIAFKLREHASALAVPSTPPPSMSAKRKPAGDGGPSIMKRQKVQAPFGHTFSTAAEIHSALQTENQDELTASAQA